MVARRKAATAASAAESAEREAEHLASLYTYGFQFQDTAERDFVSECIACRQGPIPDIAEMQTLSLMQGAQAWEQLIACAQSMQARHDFPDPLYGRDLLTFVARVLAARAEMKRVKTKRKIRDSGQVVDEGRSTLKKVKTKQNIEKGSRKGKESPFWASTPAADGGNDTVTPRTMVDKTDRDIEEEKGQQSGSRNNDTVHDNIEDVNFRASQAGAAVPGLQEHHSVTGSTATSNSGERQSTTTSTYGAAVRAALAESDAGEVADDSDNQKAGPSSERPNTPETREPGEFLTLSVIKNAESSFEISKDSEEGSTKRSETPKRITKSSFFAAPTPEKRSKTPLKSKSPRPPRGTVSCLPFPRLDAPRFGLAQENYMEDPYRLLIAVTFLIRTKGTSSMPVFRELIAEYPLPKDLMEADPAVIEAKIRHLGLSNNRTASIQKYARIWEECPPQPGVRYGIKNYPNKGDGKDVRAGELLDDDDPRDSAWEIGHLTQGRYAIDSWRIFCRDVFLGKGDTRLKDYDEAKATKTIDQSMQRKTRRRRKSELAKCLQPEWMRVLPEDKELRAYLRWMWMREGWEWDPLTGEKTVLSSEMYDAVQEGRVVWDNTGKLVMVPAEEHEQA